MTETFHDFLAEIQTDTGCTVVFTPVDSGVAILEDTWKIFLADTDAGIFDYKCNGRWAYHV